MSISISDYDTVVTVICPKPWRNKFIDRISVCWDPNTCIPRSSCILYESEGGRGGTGNASSSSWKTSPPFASAPLITVTKQCLSLWRELAGFVVRSVLNMSR
jgi:hypothetical protein